MTDLALAVTYFAPRAPAPDATLDDKAYAAEHCKQTTPTSVATLPLDGLRAACEAATRQGRKGDAGYIIAGDCTTTRKEGGPAGFVLIDADDGEPDWAVLDAYEGFAWTTHGHATARPAWRIVIPLLEPMAHGKLRCPFRGAHIRNRTQPAFLPTHSGQGVQWRTLTGQRRLNALELGGREQTFDGDADDSLLGALFEAAGWVEGEQAGGLKVRCPWIHDHSDGDPGGTVVFHDDGEGSGLGKFYCSRTKCLAADRKSSAALEALRALPSVQAELAHWSVVGLGGWQRSDEMVAAQAVVGAPAPAGAAVDGVQTVDFSGLRLAPGGWPWVLRSGTWCWLHDLEKQQYGSAILKADVRLQIKRTHPKVVQLTYKTEKGAIVELSDREFETTYEQRVAELKATYLARACLWDPSSAKLTLAALKWAPLQAREHLDVAEWLLALGGTRHARLVQWLAACVALGRPAPALYIHGELQTGKTLLARGIGRLWQSEPAPFAEALSDFNEAAATCPLMYADEGFPEKMSFNVFREMVTSPSRRVNEKYKPKYAVEGCVRIILSTNNEQALRYQKTGALTSQDMQAVADRLLVIWAGAAARNVLQKHDAASFVGENKLAEHVLWLAETVALEPANARMCARPEGADEILDAVHMARYEPVLRIVETGSSTHGVRRAGGSVWVHAPSLLAAVNDACFKAHQLPLKMQDVRDFCHAFACGPRVRIGEERMWVYPIDAARLASQISRLE